MLNAALFVLVGMEVLLIELSGTLLWDGLAAVAVKLTAGLTLDKPSS